MKFGLKDSVIESINSIFRAYPEIEQVLIYGSRSKGNYKNGSDIDLTLMGEGINYSVLLAIEGKIDDLLLPYMVDISLVSHIQNPDLLEHIRRVGQIFYQKQMPDE